MDSIYKLGHLCDTGSINIGSIGTGSLPVSGDKLKVTSTAPKFKVITQPMNVIYSALFEGGTTQLLPKITSFPVWIFGFFIFLDSFRYFENLEKE